MNPYLFGIALSLVYAAGCSASEDADEPQASDQVGEQVPGAGSGGFTGATGGLSDFGIGTAGALPSGTSAGGSAQPSGSGQAFSPAMDVVPSSPAAAASEGTMTAGQDAALDPTLAASAGQQLRIPEDCTGEPPTELRCTGLYDDVVTKQVAAAARAFVPAHRLWSDGADKSRWVYLPPGTTIDNTDPDDWVLPVGTKLFKEFTWNGRRVETRMFHKAAENRWVKATYHWNSDETAATRHAGGTVDVDGHAYTIPSGTECDQCHKGRQDRALGFEQLLLSLPGGEGLRLADLVAEGRLTDPQVQVAAQLGDDGSGLAAAAMGYLHVNCGVCCHNDNLAADAFSTGMFLRLPVAAAGGGPLRDLDPWVTTMGERATTARWGRQVRITPGQPARSLVVQLMSLRDPSNPQDRMPPIASQVVDEEGVALVSDWIRSLPP